MVDTGTVLEVGPVDACGDLSEEMDALRFISKSRKQ
jgi:hypothetical protein